MKKKRRGKGCGARAESRRTREEGRKSQNENNENVGETSQGGTREREGKREDPRASVAVTSVGEIEEDAE